MAGWRDNLKPASFKNISFEVEDLSISSGRRTATHEYANNDIPFVEDLGRRASVFSITAFVIGDDYAAKRDALVAACCDGGVGTLIHPTYGELTVICDACDVSERTSQGRMASLSLTFKLTGPQVQPGQTVDYKDQINTSADAVVAASTEDFVNRFSIAGRPASVTAPVASTATSFADKAFAALEVANSKVNQAQARLNSGLDDIDMITDAANQMLDISTNALSILRTPKVYAARTKYALDVIGQILSPMDRLRQLKASSTSDVPEKVSILNTDTPKGRDQIYMMLLLALFSQRIAIAGQAKAIVAMEFTNANDAQAVLDDFNEQIEAQLTSDTPVNGDVLENLRDLRALVNRDISDTAKRLPEITNTRLENSIPAAVLAYELYEDISRAPEISGRNKIAHPGFAPAGRNIEVLSR